mmetsp:Transcript_135047/g.349937  ORF Transcript_135047/g.349937 Transcript_135047/m.349937 type:complete len:236 (-) Transcript_135047:830-1537(-)
MHGSIKPACPSIGRSSPKFSQERTTCCTSLYMERATQALGSRLPPKKRGKRFAKGFDAAPCGITTPKWSRKHLRLLYVNYLALAPANKFVACGLTPASTYPVFLMGRPQLPGGGGELDRHPVHQHQRLALLWHGLVHHRAVPVPLNVCLEALLLRSAPAHHAALSTRDRPTPEAAEVLAHPLPDLMPDQVHKCEAKPGLSLVVTRHVEEIVAPCEALGVQQLHQHSARVIVRDVP